MCSPINGPRDLNRKMDHPTRILRRRRLIINRHSFSPLFFSFALFGIFITLTLASPASSKVGDSAAHTHTNRSQQQTQQQHHHHHHHHPKHSHHRNLNSTNSTTESHHQVPSGGLLHLLEPLQSSQHTDDDSSRVLPSSSSSSHPTEGADGQLLLPPSLDGSPVDLSNLNPKGLKFEEEPSDSYIVRSKSALLRCKTLNALNAWFTCNSGDERKIQSNQKISNYVDPEKGIRMIEIDLEVTRSDVEEHTNSGYTNPFQCWCTAYGGQHQIMSRKASVSFSYLKRHFYTEPLSRAVPVDTKHLVFDCVPPEGDPKPIVFWMKNDVIIAETQPKSFPSASSSVGLTISKKGGIGSKQAFRANTLVQKGSTRRLRARAVEEEKLPKSAQDAVKIGDYERQHPAGHEAFPDPYGAEQNSKPSKAGASSTPPKATELAKTVGDEEEEDEEYEDDEEEEGETEEDSKSAGHNGDHGGDLLPLNFDDPPPLDRNYLMTADYSLVIQQVKLTDSGNYSCGVRNPAGTRFSSQAQLSVFVNGEWSNWSSWGPCILPTGQKCGQGAQKRVRQCSSPASVPSSVQFCPGEPVQILECTIACSSISSTESYWSPWSDWSPCGHDCTQVRRRVCNNPTPDIGANDCFGLDFMVRNCSNGSLCRKIFDPPSFPPGNGPFLQQPNAPLPAEHSNEQIYFFIIFLLTLIILLCILYIALKFLNRRRHRGAKAAYHSGTNGWTDMLALERATSGAGGGLTSEEDAQAMLMLLQQQQTGSLPGGPGGVQCQLQMSGLTSAQMARFQGGSTGARSQQIVNRSHPFGTTSSSSSSSSAGNATPQPEKYPFISRLKHPGSASSKNNNLLLDHLVLRNGAVSSEAHPLPTIPSANSLNSFVTGNGSVNKYEEPIFPNGLLRSPHPSSSNHHHFLPSKPPLPPTMPQTTSALSNTSGSGNTGTISTNTTNTSESENSNESEPDYAEPIINYESSGGGMVNGPRPPSVPPPLNKNPPTPLLQRSTMVNSSLHSSEIAFSKAEKFIKLTDDLLEGGHYSMMANLGVGLYLTPGFIAPGQPETNNLYLRYGIDTAAKLPSTPLMYSSLSSVVTVAFSKSPNSGAVPPTFSSLLWRPFVLAFKHCIAVRGNSVASLAKALGSKNLTVLWQDVESSTVKQGSSGGASWTEVLRYGDEDLNTGCYVEFDAQYVYLVSKYVGRYVLCVRTDQSGPSRRAHSESPLALSLSPNLHHAEFSKLINFAITIEQLTPTEHLVKVYAYDNLPSSTLALRNDLSPTSGSSSVSASAIRLRLGRSTISSALRLSGRGGSLFFELKPPDRTRHRIKGSSRLEVPLAHVWFTSGGSTSPLAVSFIVANNSTVIRECTRKGCNTLNGSSGIYENELPFFDEMIDEDDHRLLRQESSTSPVDSSDSDELVNEADQESAAEETPNGRGNSRRKASPFHSAKQQQLDHLHEAEADLNYEVTVWQGAGTSTKNSASPISSMVTLNSATTIRLCQPANTSAYYVERSLRHLFTEVDLQVRRQIVDALDTPRSDQLDWRSLAAAAGFDHYLPFFATQPSPSASILELWEAKVLNVLLLPKAKHCRPSSSSSTSANTTNSGALSSGELSEVKDIFYSKLVHLLQTIQRSDLIELILSNQC